MELLGMGKGNAKKTAAALAKVVREARMQAWRAYVHATHGGEEEDEHKQSEEYKEHERTWAELLDKMAGWVYTLNEAAAERTDTRVTMEEVRRIIESQRIPAGKQSHKRRRVDGPCRRGGGARNHRRGNRVRMHARDGRRSATQERSGKGGGQQEGQEEKAAEEGRGGKRGREGGQ